MEQDNISKEFGRRVREARKARGWTQTDLAQALGVYKTAITKLEAGSRPTSVTEAARIAGLLGVPVENLVGDGPGASAATVAEFKLRLYAMLTSLAGLEAETRQRRDEYKALYSKFEAYLDSLPEGSVSDDDRALHVLAPNRSPAVSVADLPGVKLG